MPDIITVGVEKYFYFPSGNQSSKDVPAIEPSRKEKIFLH